MTTLFQSVLSGSRDAMLQTETEISLASQSNKELASMYPMYTGQQYSQDWESEFAEVDYRFAEPYSPERNEFQPVPIAMSIEFVDNCTGPPWSVGDTVEMMRRKEMEKMCSIIPASEYVSRPSSPYVNDNALVELGHAPTQQTPAFGRTDLQSEVLSIIEPTAETLERARYFTHIKISSDAVVPLTYIRAKIPSHYQNFFLNEMTATHDLYLTSVTGETARLPIHDLVLIGQCTNIGHVTILLQYDQKKKKERDSLYVGNVPDLNSFGILLKWLYTNDEDELYEMLKSSCLGNNVLLIGFAMNCRFWGIADMRVTAVVRALLQNLGYGST